MKWLFFLFCTSISLSSFSQFSANTITSDFVLYQRRLSFDKYMRERTINGAFALPLNTDTEEKYLEACDAVSQFLLYSPQIETGFRKMFENYSWLQYSTKRSLLEAVYGVSPSAFQSVIIPLISTEKTPRLFAMQSVYLYRADSSKKNTAYLQKLLQQQFPSYTTDSLLIELDHYLSHNRSYRKQSIPGILSLFAWRKQSGQKMVYSFQRWNRDYPGLAIIQQADGSFAKDSSGRLLVFRQLARSASDLPYFITNGSTPQGIYSIQGTAVSRNHLIGPTPNLQLIMPNETDSVFWHTGYDSSATILTNYLNLLPPVWREYAPVMESFRAGKIGRTEIIAHGTTIDPDYFKDKPFYPLTPTMGCLCANEKWNIFNGKLLESDQLNLANGFVSTPGDTGYLFVINLDNQQRPVSREEIEKMVAEFEKREW